jgi:hypothetical protein
MELYIEIDEHGNAVNHPIEKSNLDAAPDSFKEGKTFVPFTRTERPVEGVYQTNEHAYSVSADRTSASDDWVLREMTDAEVVDKKNTLKANWRADGGFASWVFDDALGVHVPPVAYPTDGNDHLWDEVSTNWVSHDSIITPHAVQTTITQPVPASAESGDEKFAWNDSTGEWQPFTPLADPEGQAEL